jgi:Mg/Co/Ni transporter MgtE
MMSERLTITEVKVDENTEIVREMNEAEWAKYLATQEAIEAAKLKKEQDELAKAALLEKLGITAEEAKLLLGGN